jgi:hypothetical protein
MQTLGIDTNMKGELTYYSFDCLECLYSAGAFYPQFAKEQKLKHEHKNGKLKIKYMGVCLIP